MRSGVIVCLAAVLLTASASAENPTARRDLSHDPPSDLGIYLLSSAVAPIDPGSDLEEVPTSRGSTVTVIEMLPNGGFESGAAIWTEASMQGWNLILEASEFPPGILPYAGNWGVWLGGDDDEIAYIQQQVTVPMGSPTLKYREWIDSEDDCGFDFGGVIVNAGTIVESYDLCFLTDTADWTMHSVDMSAYAGQTLNLQIRIETDNQLISNLFIDDVVFEYQVTPIFADGFESGDTSAWSGSTP